MTKWGRFSILSKRSRESTKNWKASRAENGKLLSGERKKFLTNGFECAKLNELSTRKTSKNSAVYLVN